MSVPPLSPELISRAEFARMLSIGESTLDRMRASGKIGPVPIRIGGSLRWRRDDVMAWIHAGSNGDLPDAATWRAMQSRDGTETKRHRAV